MVGDDIGPHHFSLQISACGEAAHPDRARALRKALLEFVGSRSRKAATHGPVERARQVLPPAYVARQTAGSANVEEVRALDAMTDWLALDPASLRRLLTGSAFKQHRHVGFESLPTVPAGAVCVVC